MDSKLSYLDSVREERRAEVVGKAFVLAAYGQKFNKKDFDSYFFELVQNPNRVLDLAERRPFSDAVIGNRVNRRGNPRAMLEGDLFDVFIDCFEPYATVGQEVLNVLKEGRVDLGSRLRERLVKLASYDILK